MIHTKEVSLMSQISSELNANPSLVIGIKEAGAMLGLNKNAAYAAAKRGDIPTIRIGRLIKVPKAAFNRLLEQAGAK